MEKFLENLRKNIKACIASDPDYAGLSITFECWTKPLESPEDNSYWFIITGTYHDTYIEFGVNVIKGVAEDGTAYAEDVKLCTDGIAREMPMEGYFEDPVEFEFACLWARDRATFDKREDSKVYNSIMRGLNDAIDHAKNKK